VIGARTYIGTSARDRSGHGSHTSSTAAGLNVANASFFGLAGGVARGGVPSARIAVYKVCDPTGCDDSNILAAFDDAIADGVDLITISIGGSVTTFKSDTLAIGAFHAMLKGILTVQSAGNSGNSSYSVGSVAPWIFTVAASSTDRKIVDKVELGNGKTFTVCITSFIRVVSLLVSHNKFLLILTRQSHCQNETIFLCSVSYMGQSLIHQFLIFLETGYVG